MASIALPLLFIYQKTVGRSLLSWVETLGMTIASFLGGLVLTLLYGQLKNLAFLLGGSFINIMSRCADCQILRKAIAPETLVSE